MNISTNDILKALQEEREFANQSIGFSVTSSRHEGVYGILKIEISRQTGSRAAVIDESLEGSRVYWEIDEQKGQGEVFFTNADEGELVIRYSGAILPKDGDTIWLYRRDFLTPLIELWEDKEKVRKAAFVLNRKKRGHDDTLELPKKFEDLRARQSDAIQASLSKASLILGPPGTGKTFTLGAMVAYLLVRYKNSRIILTGPTNTAVDTALLSVDKWLKRLGRIEQFKNNIKRVGSHFDPRKYRDTPYLLAPGFAETATELAILELEEPSKADVAAYTIWKEKVEITRSKLRTDITEISSRSRLIALTTASAYIWYEELKNVGNWNFIVCDEASQVIMPGALMAGALANRSVFMGDPHQLPPVVQCHFAHVQKALNTTVFDVLKKAERVQLNEQSRMGPAKCNAVSKTFYSGDLKVCPKYGKDPEWKKYRSPVHIDGRPLPHVHFEFIEDEAQWSKKYNGYIRLMSADAVRNIAEELLGSYTDAEDIVVLTPFRSQRALIRKMFYKDHLRPIRVSTVHKAQGTESKIIIFDPVQAGGPFLNSENGRRLINVATSRAQAHIIFIANKKDLQNPWVKKIHGLADTNSEEYYTPLNLSRAIAQ